MIETTICLKSCTAFSMGLMRSILTTPCPRYSLHYSKGKKKTKSTYGTFYPESWAENQGTEVDEATGMVKVQAR